MKYTAIQPDGVLQIVPVSGCTTCPHKTEFEELGRKVMRCTCGSRNKKLIGNWAGAYHSSCPLPSQAKAFQP